MTGSEAAGMVRTMRRHLLLGSVIRMLLLGIVALGFVATWLWPDSPERAEQLWFAAVFAAAGWVSLAMFSARQVRATNQASVYISTGRLDLAEERLMDAMRLVSLYRTGKLLICHNLAVVAHGQKNYAAAAELCDGLVAAGAGVSRGLGRMCRILLADCRLLLGDTAAAVEAIAPLSLDHPDLGLSEQLMLLPVQLRCQAATGQFEAAAEAVDRKVRLAELLDAPKAAVVHAILARACRAVGRTEIAEFLRRRAELYHDLTTLTEQCPVLADSPSDEQLADNNAT